MVTDRPENRFTAPDLGRLMACSARLRGFMAMLARNPARYVQPGSLQAFQQLCDEVRLDLRVAIELPPGVSEPRNDAQALRFMERERYCRTGHWDRVQSVIDRSWPDPRLLETVGRAVRDARRLRVPLFPAAVDLPGEVHIGHAVERFLPWACWDLVADWVIQAGIATGYRLVPAEFVPGHFRLVDDAPPYRQDAGMRPERLSPEAARAEREELWAFYQGVSDD